MQIRTFALTPHPFSGSPDGVPIRTESMYWSILSAADHMYVQSVKPFRRYSWMKS